MNHSETITKLAAALVKAQSEMPSVTKDRTNPAFKFRYATLDAILETVKPILARHSLAVFQSGGESAPGSACVQTMILHESGEWIMSAVTLPLGKNDAQGVGSAMTYGRRYGLSAALSLATDEDDDANAASRPAKQAKADVPKPAPATEKPTDPTVMPTGDFAGKPLTEVPTPELKALVTYLKGKDAAKYKQIIANANTIVTDRLLGTRPKNPTDDQRVAGMKAGVAADDAGLPFK